MGAPKYVPEKKYEKHDSVGMKCSRIKRKTYQIICVNYKIKTKLHTFNNRIFAFRMDNQKWGK